MPTTHSEPSADLKAANDYAGMTIEALLCDRVGSLAVQMERLADLVEQIVKRLPAAE